MGTIMNQALVQLIYSLKQKRRDRKNLEKAAPVPQDISCKDTKKRERK